MLFRGVSLAVQTPSAGEEAREPPNRRLVAIYGASLQLNISLLVDKTNRRVYIARRVRDIYSRTAPWRPLPEIVLENYVKIYVTRHPLSHADISRLRTTAKLFVIFWDGYNRYGDILLRIRRLRIYARDNAERRVAPQSALHCYTLSHNRSPF